jgi:hypothetical protein
MNQAQKVLKNRLELLHFSEILSRVYVFVSKGMFFIEEQCYIIV